MKDHLKLRLQSLKQESHPDRNVRFRFFFISFIHRSVREKSISIVLFKKLISFVLKIIVHFPSI